MDTDSDMMVPSAPVETTAEEDYFVPPPPPDELILVRLTHAHAHAAHLQHPVLMLVLSAFTRQPNLLIPPIYANTSKPATRWLPPPINPWLRV